MRWLVTSRRGQGRLELHYSDGSVECWTDNGDGGKGVQIACDPASVQAQQTFYNASVARDFAPIPGVQTYHETAKIQDATSLAGGGLAGEIGSEIGLTSYPTPQPPVISGQPIEDPFIQRKPLDPAEPVRDWFGEIAIENEFQGRYVPNPEAGMQLVAAPPVIDQYSALSINWGKVAEFGINVVKAIAGGGQGSSSGGSGPAISCGPGLVPSNGRCIPSGNFAASGSNATSCPPGQVKIGSTCINPGAALPGGKPFITSQGQLQPAVGRYGLGYAPVVESMQALRCGPGGVLGKDNLCYQKRDLRRGDRKWSPGARPLLTGGEMNALRKVGSIRKRLKKAAGTADLSCSKKGCSCKTPSRRKK